MSVEIPAELYEELVNRAREITNVARAYGKRGDVDADRLLQHVLLEYVRSYGAEL